MLAVVLRSHARLRLARALARWRSAAASGGSDTVVHPSRLRKAASEAVRACSCGAGGHIRTLQTALVAGADQAHASTAVEAAAASAAVQAVVDKLSRGREALEDAVRAALNRIGELDAERGALQQQVQVGACARDRLELYRRPSLSPTRSGAARRSQRPALRRGGRATRARDGAGALAPAAPVCAPLRPRVCRCGPQRSKSATRQSCRRRHSSCMRRSQQRWSVSAGAMLRTAIAVSCAHTLFSEHGRQLAALRVAAQGECDAIWQQRRQAMDQPLRCALPPRNGSWPRRAADRIGAQRGAGACAGGGDGGAPARCPSVTPRGGAGAPSRASVRVVQPLTRARARAPQEQTAEEAARGDRLSRVQQEVQQAATQFAQAYRTACKAVQVRLCPCAAVPTACCD